MDNKNELQEFNLDDILNEFHDLPEEDTVGDIGELAGNSDDLKEELEKLDHLLEDLPEAPVLPQAPEAETPAAEVPEAEAAEAVPVEQPEVSAGEPSEESEAESTPMDTIRMVEIIKEITKDAEDPESTEEPAVSDDPTIHIDELGAEHFEDETSEGAAPEDAAETDAAEEEAPLPPPVIEFNPRARLRELKRKLVAGPEKRYYELSEIGVGRLQIAILINIIIVLLCAGTTTLFTLNLVPDNRLRFVIFSQVLAMLVSALLGCHLMMDSLSDLLKGRFSVNTLLTLTFLACCVDAVFCLKELRVPCCAAFSLEMTLALWARYQRRSTEMAQMDTLRKAVRLHGLVKEPDFYEGKPGILRTEGRLEDFWDHYQATSGPEKLQNFYAVLSLLCCIGIAVFAGMLHGISLAVQVLSTSLLVAVPASFFISISRPMAILERRLHMVGTVLCGWQGVKDLCGKAAFPLSDEDLFPQGSTKLNGVKFYGDRDPDDVVSYTTSLICAAGGGLVPIFRQMNAGRNGNEYPVANLQNYGSGGIGGEVRDEPVLLGSLNFLQDMGVEIPEGTMVNQAVYAAIDGQLCAVFAISYAKMRSAAGGIVTLCGYRKLTPVLTGGDFMLTESMLRGKFNIKTRRMAFPPREVRKELAARQPDPQATAMALTTRDDLVSSAYAVTGARSLRTATKLGVAVHLVGGILGMLIMLVMAYLGRSDLITPTHVLLYQLVWLVPGILITEWTRNV